MPLKIGLGFTQAGGISQTPAALHFFLKKILTQHLLGALIPHVILSFIQFFSPFFIFKCTRMPRQMSYKYVDKDEYIIQYVHTRGRGERRASERRH